MKVVIACSDEKLNIAAPAKDLYQGAIFKLCKIYFEKFNIPWIILSAKYGFIDPEQVIDPYDQKMETTYTGSFPDDVTHYIGGVLYFGNSPEHVTSLVPSGSYGKICTYINLLINGYTPEEIAVFASRLKIKGIVQFIYESLYNTELTKEELFEKLCNEYGYSPSYKKTINAQLTPNRIGKEKRCNLHRNGDKFSITADKHFYE